jgi:polysaccharide pyruvyl transferase WcaK-like protein
MGNKKIFMIRGAGFANKGAEAMLLTLVDNALKYNMQSSFIIPVKELYKPIAKKYGFIPLVKSEKTTMLSRLSSKKEHFFAYLECQAVLDVGGYQFGDRWGSDSAMAVSKKIYLRNMLKTPTYFFPQAWGPFEDASFGKSIPGIINNSAMVFVRDSKSLQYIKEIVPKAANVCRLGNDIAWVFQGEKYSWGKVFLEGVMGPLSHEIPIVCITPNMRIYEKYKCVDEKNPYLNYLIEVTSRLLTHKTIKVIFLGHELRIAGDNQKDDSYLCKWLSDKVNHENVNYIDAYLSARQVKSIIGCCSLILSSRYHALIAALSQGVPAVALGWSHKYNELMNSVGLADKALNMDLGVDHALHHIDEMIQNREALINILGQCVHELKNNASTVLQSVFDEIYTRH